VGLSPPQPNVAAIKAGWLHFEAVSRNSAASHFVSGILERSKTVFTVTVNCSRHSLHW
jgi:hypothetical protein